VSNAPRLNPERILWEAYPSWKHFTWLYFFAGLSALRGSLFFTYGIPTWEAWFIGAFFLLGCVAVIRHWGHYFITSEKVQVKNGYTGRDIDAITLGKIKDVTITQGPVASFFNIGTLTIQSVDPNQTIRFRGIKDPEVVKVRLEALRPAISEADAI
jgi:membrane protein YdbS with pleckstrin-like domain